MQLIQRKENEDYYTLKRLFKREPTGAYFLEEVGYFNQRYKLVLTKSMTPTAVRRKNLMGTVLNTCLVVTYNDTFNHLRDKR